MAESVQRACGGVNMGQKLPEEIQQEIWDESPHCTIGQIAKKYGISHPTARKYMNPRFK